MSLSATTPIATIAATNANGAVTKAKNGVAKNGSNGNGALKEKDAKLSSAELIRLEHEHEVHNYHPLPVVFDRAQSAKVRDPEGREYIDMLSAYYSDGKVRFGSGSRLFCPNAEPEPQVRFRELLNLNLGLAFGVQHVRFGVRPSSNAEPNPFAHEKLN
ncbi:hypothetical protein K438DRAFT_2122285 [Mycena galopus ATCC 62051]|nr:hypothetical protein K438DRAFT_2122285 [Mycena galopus ATCC 62051]